MEEYAVIMLLPWLKIMEKIELGDIQFIPWRRGEGLSGISFLSQEDATMIMSDYVDVRGEEISEAVFMLHGNCSENGQLSESQMNEAAEAAQLLAFSAISKNDYFDRGGFYVNASYFRYFYQRLPIKENFSLACRRREGFFYDFPYKHGEATFHSPQQCMRSVDIDPDKGLLEALSTILKKETPIHEGLLQSIRLFIMASTDDIFMPTNQELTLMVMAYEGLFSNCQGAYDLACKISILLGEYGRIEIGKSTYKDYESLKDLSQGAWLHLAWMRECYQLRNDYIHGNDFKRREGCWQEQEHNVFAAWLFPLIVKLVLSKESLYTLSNEDEVALFAADRLLDSKDWGKEVDRYPRHSLWKEIIADASYELAAERAKREWEPPL
jgi:hypothetical protein